MTRKTQYLRSIGFDEITHQRLKELKEESHVSISALVNDIVSNYFIENGYVNEVAENEEI